MRRVSCARSSIARVSIYETQVLLGGYSSEVPPLPIPNREVKLTHADGTAFCGGRVGSRLFKPNPIRVRLFCVYVCICVCGRCGYSVNCGPMLSADSWERNAVRQDCAGRSLGARRPATAFASLRSPQAAARKHFVNSHASAHLAAEAISDKGRPRRRSVKNRRLFDPQKCEASDSAQALWPTPKSFHRGGF